MTETYTPRDYQDHAIKTGMNFLKYRTGNGYTVAPGGSGKSVLIAKMGEPLYDAGHRIVIMARSERLITQNAAKFAPEYQDKIGIYCAGLGRKETHQPITIGTVQSLAGVVLDQPPTIALIDECHEINPDSEGETQYWQFLRANGNPRIYGFTATAFRTASGVIQWGEEVVNIPIAPLFEAGYIVPPVNKIGAEVDLSNVPVTALGEYSAPHLELVYDDPELLRVSVEKLLFYAENRKHPLVFCQNLKHCDAVASALEYEGQSVITVSGDTRKDELAYIIKCFERGDFKYLINCQLLTTGWDIPCVDMVALLMATKSKGKFEQILYRGTRLFPEENKTDFLVLDMGMNFYEHGGLGSPIRDKKKRGEQQPRKGKVCPECEQWVENALDKECPECGYVFIIAEPPKVKHAYEADNESKTYYSNVDTQIETHEVSHVSYKDKKSKSGNPMIVVEYHCDYGKYGTIAEFLLPHHESDFVRGKVREFIKVRGGNAGFDLFQPIVAIISYLETLPHPAKILVDHAEQFPRIKNVYFDAPTKPTQAVKGFDLDDEIAF